MTPGPFQTPDSPGSLAGPFASQLLGDFQVQGVVPKLSDTPGSVCTPEPDLGQHDAEIYGGLLGHSAERLSELETAGVI